MNTMNHKSALSCAVVAALLVGVQAQAANAPPVPLPMTQKLDAASVPAVEVIKQTPIPEDKLIEPTGQELATDYISTPVGKVHKSCAFEVKDGAAVAAHPACKYKSYRAERTEATKAPTVNGWVETSYVYAPSPGWYWYAAAAWYVPSNPTTGGALLYMFPALQNTSGATTILQPVMQWGNNGAWGGNYWSIASWWGPDSAGNYHYSTPYYAYAGQIIDGTLNGLQSCTAAGVCTWTITTAVRGGVSTSLTVRTGYVYNWAFPFALEAYGLTVCSQYPASGAEAAAANLYLGNQYTVSTATWSPWVMGGSPSCHYNVVISPNPGATYLYNY